MNVNGPDGKSYQFPEDVTDSELTTFFAPKPGVIDNVISAPLSRVAQGINSANAGFLSTLAKGAKKVADFTGLPASGAFDAAAKAAQEGADYWGRKADPVMDPNSVVSKVYGGIGSAPMGLAKFAAGVPFAAAEGAVENGVGGAVKSGLERFAVGKVFKGLESANLSPVQRSGAMAGTMAAQTAAEGGSLKDVVASGLTGLALSAPGETGARSVVRQNMQRAGALPEVAADLSGRFNPDIQPAGMGSINTNNVDTVYSADQPTPAPIRDSEQISLTGNESRPPSVTRGPVLDAENASRISPYDATGPSPGLSIEVARFKQEHPYWSDAESLKEASKTVLTHNPEVLPAATERDTYRNVPTEPSLTNEGGLPQAVRQSEDAPGLAHPLPIGNQEMGQRFGTSDRITDPADPGWLLNPEVLPARTDSTVVRPELRPVEAERPAEQAPSRTVEAQSMENFSPHVPTTNVDSNGIDWQSVHGILTAPINNYSTVVKGVAGPATDSAFTKTFSQVYPSLFTFENPNFPKASFAKSDIQATAKNLSGGRTVDQLPPKQKMIADRIIADELNMQEMTREAQREAELYSEDISKMSDAELSAANKAADDFFSQFGDKNEPTEKATGGNAKDVTGTESASPQNDGSQERNVATSGVADLAPATTVYHGSNSATPMTPDAGGNVHYFTAPGPARLYGKVNKSEVRLDNPLIVDAGGRTKGEWGNYDESIAEAKRNGNDAVIIKNIIDVPTDMEEGYYKDRLSKYKSDVVIPIRPDVAPAGQEGGGTNGTQEKGRREGLLDNPDTSAEPTMLHAGIHIPTLIQDAKDLWNHYTAKLDPTAPAGSVKEFLDANRKANDKFGTEPLIRRLKRALIDSSANVQDALMREGSAGEFVRRQFDAISGASAKAQVRVEQQREALNGMSLREQQAMGDMIAIDRDLAIADYRYKVPTSDPKELYQYIGGKTPAELSAARKTFQADYKLSDSEMARVDNATKQYFDAWKQNTQRMLDSGLIDATQKAALDTHEYSPKQFLEKIDPDTQSFNAIGGSRVTVPDSGIKRLKEGSDGYFRNNPMRLLSEATARVETRIARNEANQALASLPASNGIAEAVKPGTAAPAGYEAISYMENGKQQTIHMKSEYAKEWRQNDPLINSELVNALQWLTGAKIVRAGATGYNPAFLVSNVPRDLVTIWMQAEKQGYSKHAPIALSEMANDLVSVSKDAWSRKGRYLDYVNQGGARELLTHAGALSNHRENLAPAVAKVQKVLSYVNEFSEIVTRLAYRERMIKNGMDPALASKASAEYVDFSRGGSVSKAVDRLGVPYLNAAIQGTRSLARSAGRDPGAFAYKTAQLMMGAAGLYAINQMTNPEGWANVSDREKSSNFIIMLPKQFEYADKDGTTVSPYFKISKEQSMQPFVTVAELAVDWANGGKPTPQQIQMALGTALPVSLDKMPPTAAAFWTYALNADTYKKEPVWKGKQEIEPYAEYTNSTNPIYTAIGKATASRDAQGVMRGGISPERLKAGVEKIITPSNAYIQAAGNGLTDMFEKMNPSDKVTFEKTNYEQIRSVPGVSRLLGGAKDTEQFREGIRDTRVGTATQQFEVNKTLDAMVLRYVKTGKSDPALYDRIVTHVAKQPGEIRSRMEHRIEGLVETADLPDRGWWMSVRALQPEDRADQFKARLKTVSPGEQRRMLDLADNLTGFGSDRFWERYDGSP
jgi:hypothetical protein